MAPAPSPAYHGAPVSPRPQPSPRGRESRWAEQSSGGSGDGGRHGLAPVHEAALRRRDAGPELDRDAGLGQRHLDATEGGEHFELVQSTEVPDPEHLAPDSAEPDSERQVVALAGDPHHLAGVEAVRGDDGG